MIGVIVRTHDQYGSHILDGIVDYSWKHMGGRWDNVVVVPWSFAQENKANLARFEAAIVQLESRAMAEQLLEAGIPSVNVSDRLSNSGIPTVMTDDLAVGASAARHLLDRGFHNFVYVGDIAEALFSDLRGQGFTDVVRAAGYSVVWHGRFPGDLPSGATRAAEEWSTWILHTPKPVGLFVCHDWQASWLCTMVIANGFVVPDEVAIVGVDDDPMGYYHSVGISSIKLPCRQIGFEAATWIDELLSGVEIGTDPLLIPPHELTIRTSSDTIAINDADVLSAMKFIKNNACRGIDVNTVAGAVNLSRRTLERRFTMILGTTPLLEIRRARIEQAKYLLVHSSKSVTEIAHAVGCRDRSHLSADMRSLIGKSPRQYRDHAKHDAGHSGPWHAINHAKPR